MAGQHDVWAAWGTLILKRPYLKTCLTEICDITREISIAWYSLGRKSVQGHPHHPLYLRREAPMDPFDIESYLQGL